VSGPLLPKVTVSPTTDGYLVRWEDAALEATVERIDEKGDGVTAEIRIRSVLDGGGEMLAPARVNLMAPQTRRGLARDLAARDGIYDWDGMLTQLIRGVLDLHRIGEPEIDLRSYSPDLQTRWVLEPFVERGGPTILFADGGTGKSFFAMAIAVSVSSGRPVVGHLRSEACPVLYLDWETDADTVQERIQAIRWAAGISEAPPIYYRRQSASLIESSSEIRRIIARRVVGLVVVDSLGAARGGEPESADLTIRTFNAARSWGVPWLAVDHVTKAAGNDSTKPFGSAYTPNLSRLTWSMDKADEDRASQKVALVNRKQNNIGRQPSIGYRMIFERDSEDVLVSLAFKQFDLAADGDLGRRASTAERILSSLASGGKEAGALAVELEASANLIRARLADLQKRGAVVKKDDLWWLTARGH